jgi:hypothetical protein
MREQVASQHEVYLELKYCERCGSLWFRECGSSRVYCDGCLPALNELPPVTERLQIIRLPGQHIPGEDDEEFDVHDINATNWRPTGGVA